MELVTSRSNPTIKLVRALRGRRAVRYREKLFVAEGPRTVTTLAESGAAIHTLLLDADSRDTTGDEPLRLLVERAERVLTVTPALLRWISDTESPQPLLAICRMPADRQPPAGADLVLALDGVRDPGNLGTIIRSAVAADVDWIGLLPGTVDPYNPKVVRGTAGLVTRLPLLNLGGIAGIEAIGGDHKLAPVVAAASGQTRYDEVDWTRPSVLVIGGEATGVREDSYPSSAISAYVPMAAGVESLNAGVAASLMLFEAARQRRNARGE